MNRQEILSRCDHTILKPEAVWEERFSGEEEA